MAGQIRITPETMRTRAGEYRTQADAVGDVITAMDNLLLALQDEWEGSASEAYATKFGELRPGFVDAQSLINDIATALDTVATNLESVDGDIASQFAQ